MRLTKPRVTLLAAVVAVCTVALATHDVRAANVNFSIDPTQSYLTFVIPNFTLSGLTINVTGQNPATGAPVGGPWSAATGNFAGINGGFTSDIGGPGVSVSDVASGIQPTVTFLTGSNSMAAQFTGNYRPNPAAWNGSTTSGYINNGPAPGNYGATVHTQLGNGGLTNTTLVGYNLASSTLPVAAGTFPTNFAGMQNFPLADNGLGPTGTGSGVFLASKDTSGGLYAIQGIPLFVAGKVIPDIVLPLGFADQFSNGLTPGTIQFGGVEGGNGGLVGVGLGNLITPNSAPGTLGLTSLTNLQVIVPMSIPFVLNVTSTVQVNGYLTGQVVANATVPEPSTIALAAAGGLVSLGALWRRRRMARRST